MNILKNTFLFICLLFLSCSRNSPQFVEFTTEGMTFYKGNTHSHTTESDGDSSPLVVAQWYKDHGYNFLILTDHNVLTDKDRLIRLFDTDFTMFSGEEVTTSYDGKSIHVNGLNISELVLPENGNSVVETIQNSVNLIRKADGVPHINHPNFQWSLNYEDLSEVKNYKLLEIHNGHPSVHNLGGGGIPGMEEVWDKMLSSGMEVYGIAVDDAHHFKGEFAPGRSNPGRGWVTVFSPALTAADIMASLENGHFYASSGVELDEISAKGSRMTIKIREKSSFKFRTEFIGENGTVLFKTEENPAVYELNTHTSYVRAKVTDSGGFAAWTMPMRVQQ